jgi:5,10-methylenetetrahydromethanopterin reductase
VVECIAEAERAGFDYAWVPDSQLLHHEVWIALALAAGETSRITLGPNVTNPLTRHPTVTAAAAATLDQATGRRVVLGLGSGDSAVRVMGIKTARLEELRASVALMRQLWRGEWASQDEHQFRLGCAPGRALPIYIAATGPRMLQLAGEIADGVFLQAGIGRESLEYCFRNLELGAERAGRSVRDLDVVAGAFTLISDDWRAQMAEARPLAAMFALRSREALQDSGIPVPEAPPMPDLYPDLSHAEDWEAAKAATAWVPDAVLEAFCQKYCLFGTGQEVAERIEELASWGITNFYIRDFYTYRLPNEILATFREEVMPRFHAA